jgi:hypothetical protein
MRLYYFLVTLAVLALTAAVVVRLAESGFADAAEAAASAAAVSSSPAAACDPAAETSRRAARFPPRSA